MNLKKMQSNLFSQKTFENSDVLVFVVVDAFSIYCFYRDSSILIYTARHRSLLICGLV